MSTPPSSFRRRILLLLLAFSCVIPNPIASADWLEALGLRKKSRGASAGTLAEEQIAAGLSQALLQGVDQAVKALGRIDGFLGDPKVRIPLPAGLQRAESALRGLGQDRIADEFVTTLNRAAEQAVPEAASVLADSVRQLTLSDVRGILSSTNAAATDYFRRTSWTNLHSRLLPIVKTSTQKAGVTSSYQAMIERSGLRSDSLLGRFGRSVLGADPLDLDDYVTRQALEGLYLKMGEEEMKIRENPSARTTDLLRQVFGR